jgi:hypothetical protein
VADARRRLGIPGYNADRGDRPEAVDSGESGGRGAHR